MAHNSRRARKRHVTSGIAATRDTHGGSIDPTTPVEPLYGSQMDVEAPGVQDQGGAIVGEQIGPGEIGSDHIAAFAILAEHLAEAAVEVQALADGAVTSTKIEDNAITTPKVAANAITALKIAAGSITSAHISVGGLLAEQITSGTLSVGGLAGAPDVLVVYDSTGAEVMRIDQNGWLLKDPANVLNQVRFRNGVMQFSPDGGVGWTTAISAAGITADAITVGKAPGGHNLVPNSSFERTPFATLQVKTWTLAADWGTTIGTDVNVDKTTGDLKLTTATY